MLDSLRSRVRQTPLHTAWRFASSAVGGWRERTALEGVEVYCIFIGHPRSGHSIVGALLDAHPQIVISDELDALRYVEAGFSRRQLLYLPIAVSRSQARHERRKAGSGGATYSYFVPGQWQGRHRELQVIGDSRAGWTVRRLTRNPGLLGRLERRMAPTQLRYLHVLRNPFDNIATMMQRGGRSFEDAVGLYFGNCAAIERLGERIGPDRLMRIRHEDVITAPHGTLTTACRFLGVEPDAAYLDACAGILFASPSRSRERITWTDEQRARVQARIGEFAFLAGYDYAS